MPDVTKILSRIETGDPDASKELLPLVYDELRKLARARMAAERPDHTLQATALVHEAYVRLVGSDQTSRWNSRAHFFGAAAEAMRRILVENARRRSREKRGGDRIRLEMSEDHAVVEARDQQLLDVHNALDELAVTDPSKAELVKLRYFAGFTIDEAAEALQISRSTAKREWTYARAWLLAALEERSEEQGP